MRTEMKSRPMWRLVLAGVAAVAVASTCAAVWGPVLGAPGRTDRGVVALPGSGATTTASTDSATTSAAPSTTTIVAPAASPSSTVASATVPSTTVVSTTVVSTTVVSATVPSTTVASTTVPSTTVAAARGGDEAFLACVRHRESRGRYDVVNPDSGAGGAYQFMATTWNNTARHAGRWDLVGVAPQHASVADQDAMARHLLGWYGRSPWAHPTLPC